MRKTGCGGAPWLIFLIFTLMTPLVSHGLKLRRPLAFFDLETTGTSLSSDRIIEFSVVKALPGGETRIYTQKVNPTVPIPLASSLIHGIYDEDVRDCPTFAQVAHELAKFLLNCDLAGFNMLKFDLPLLIEEFYRAGVNFEYSQAQLIDAQKVFHLMEPRNLSAAFQFYTGKPMDTLGAAHSAEVDTIATLMVFDEQVKRYMGRTCEEPGRGTKVVLNDDMDTYHKLTSHKVVDLAGRFTYNQQGRVVFNFGKHKDKPVDEVLNREPSYYDWMMQGDFPRETKERLAEIKRNMRAPSLF